MPIGTSLGAYFDDSFHHQAGIDTPPDTGDDNVVPPDQGTYDQPKTLEVADKAPDKAAAISIHPVEDVHPAPDYLNPPDRSEGSATARPSLLNAVTGMANPSTDEDKEILTGFYEHAKNALGLTQAPEWGVDPETGEVHTSTQAIEKAADLANLMVTGPAPVAAKAADGTLGSFMGVKSLTINKPALYKAQEMEMAGEHPDAIWDTAGTMRGADNRWKQEIDDSKMNLKPEIFEASPNNPNNLKLIDKYDKTNFFGEKKSPLFLKDVINHPDLFNAYPHLGNVKVEPVNGFEALAGLSGSYNPGSNTLKIGRQPLEELKKTILHETQHAIQLHEGFSFGSAPAQFIPPEAKEFSALAGKTRISVENEMRKAGFTMSEIMDARYGIEKEMTNDTHFQGIGAPGMRDSYKGVLPTVEKVRQAGFYDRLKTVLESEKLADEYTTRARKDYFRTMGEVEARNVEARMAYSDWNRAAVPPVRTESVPREEQISSPMDKDRLEWKSASSEKPIQFRRAANDNVHQEAFIDEEGRYRGPAIDRAVDEVDKSWKDFAKTQEERGKLREKRSKLRDILEDRDWNEFEIAQYNKSGKALYGKDHVPED